MEKKPHHQLNSINLKRPTVTDKQQHLRNRRKHHHHQPLKVVYITNPIKFKATASQFRALVQELTGRDAAYPPESGFPVEPAAETSNNNARAAVVDEELADGEFKGGQVGGSDPPPPPPPAGIWSGTDQLGFYCDEMNLIQDDVLQSFDGI